MIPLLATLAIAAQVFVLTVVGCAIAQRFGRRRPLDGVVTVLGRDALRLAALVAVIATAGSLYFSEVRHFPPCPLCWYQRIAMYPLVVVLGIAAVLDDRRIGRYVLPLTAIGAALSTYHRQLELFPDQGSISCSADVPCTTVWFQQFGYITMPVLALSAFALIAALVWIGGRHGQSVTDEA